MLNMCAKGEGTSIFAEKQLQLVCCGHSFVKGLEITRANLYRCGKGSLSILSPSRVSCLGSAVLFLFFLIPFIYYFIEVHSQTMQFSHLKMYNSMVF